MDKQNDNFAKIVNAIALEPKKTYIIKLKRASENVSIDNYLRAVTYMKDCLKRLSINAIFVDSEFINIEVDEEK